MSLWRLEARCRSSSHTAGPRTRNRTIAIAADEVDSISDSCTFRESWTPARAWRRIIRAWSIFSTAATLRETAENVLITLNAVDFTDPFGPDISVVSVEFSGRGRRRPEFDQLAGSDRPRPGVSFAAERELRSRPRAEIRQLSADRRQHRHRLLPAGILQTYPNTHLWDSRPGCPGDSAQPRAAVLRYCL